MRKFSVIFTLGLFILLFFCFSLINYAAEFEAVIVFRDGEYVAYSGTEVISSSKSLGALIGGIPYERVVLDSLTITEPVTLRRNVIISGNFECCSDLTVEAGTSASLDSAILTLNGEASIRVRGGTLTLNNAYISADSVAVRTEDMDSSRLVMNSGECTSHSGCALEIARGQAVLLGGSIKSSSQSAIINDGALYICDGVTIGADSYHISSSVPIYSYDGTLPRDLTLMLKQEFKEGEIHPCIIGADKLCDNVRVFDSLGAEHSLSYFEEYPTLTDKNFICVYKPYKINFVIDGEVRSTYALFGERIERLAIPQKSGYFARGWFLDAELERQYDFSTPVSSSLTLYAGYSLLSPTFTLEEFHKEYDGAALNVSLSGISHPLLDSGVISYKWYNDAGEVISCEDSFTLTAVSDSGKYYCHLTFSYDKDKIEIIIPGIVATISKGVVDIPTIPPLVYNGETQYPSIPNSELYTVSAVGQVNSGEYSATLTLLDADNYKWQGSEEESVVVSYKITKAHNVWISEPSCPGIYETLSPTPSARALFGECEYKIYSDIKLTREASLPLSAGEYYCVIYVSEGDNYSGLYSQPIRFTVLRVVPISLECILVNTELFAFETLNEGDVVLTLRLSDGGTLALSLGDVSVSYGEYNGLRAGDGCVLLSYGEIKCTVPVTVNKADFDLSKVAWGGLSHTYDGEVKTPYLLNLPSGLTVKEYIGSGAEVGEYTVSAVFDYDTENYDPPIFPSATLTILPPTVIPDGDEGTDVRPYVLASVFILTLGLLLFVLLRRREPFLAYISAGRAERCRHYVSEADKADNVGSVLSVNAERADELISDSLARTLIRKNPTPIKARGTARAIINLDTISEAYESGSTVDVNSLKEKGLVPPNACYLKVLGRGVIDKPLRIYANSFSLNAVKMIALTGGEANKIQVKRLK